MPIDQRARIRLVVGLLSLAALVSVATGAVMAASSQRGGTDRLLFGPDLIDRSLNGHHVIDVAPSRLLQAPTDRRHLSPVAAGGPDHPFAPLPDTGQTRLVVSTTGLALPVIAERPSGWLVSTPCQAVALVDRSRAEPVDRVHVVIDPGHGGAEPGAVGPSGLVEKDLNLVVSRRAAELLTEAGATVLLTRDGDHTMTAAARGLVARATGAGLLVSVHHNGGAPAGDGGPGTIVFTRTGSPESTRFGGLFHQTLQPVLSEAADQARERHREWEAAMDAYDAELATHLESVAARDQALVSNGQVPPDATTSVPVATTTPAGETRTPRLITPGPTTTTVPTVDSTVPVPDTVAAPTPPEGEAVAPFRWAGSANAGVRSWVRPDGDDYLAVLRHAGPTPAALVEFLYVSNPSEEALLADQAFLDRQAEVLADAVLRFLAGEQGGTGLVADQRGDQPIGGSGGRRTCVEPPLD